MIKNIKIIITAIMFTVMLAGTAVIASAEDNVTVETEDKLVSITVSLGVSIIINPNAANENETVTGGNIRIVNETGFPMRVTMLDILDDYGNEYVSYNTNKIPDTDTLVNWDSMGTADTAKYIAFSVDGKDVYPDTPALLRDFTDDRIIDLPITAKTGYAWDGSGQREYELVLLIGVDAPPDPEGYLFKFEIYVSMPGTITLQITNVSAVSQGLYINWGDGKGFESITADNPAKYYDSTGLRVITVCGSNYRISFYRDNWLTRVITPLPQLSSTNLQNIFASCGNLASIPDGLFANNSQVTSFDYAFYACHSLSTIPEDLFANNTQVTNFVGEFQLCSGLTSIPENLFANNTQATMFRSVFSLCYNLTSIPENLFANNTMVTEISSFSSCISLTSIPENLFANNTQITSFLATFSGCTGLTSIPENLFANNKQATSFTQTFQNCTGLTTVPENLFASNTQATSFVLTFAYCYGLDSIPGNLFAHNTLVRNFQESFSYCTSLTLIPENLFANNAQVTSFFSVFENCISLTSIPENLFTNNTRVQGFVSVFSGCRNLTGNAPELWLRTDPVPGGRDCFAGCTNLTNYMSIPVSWGGGLES